MRDSGRQIPPSRGPGGNSAPLSPCTSCRHLYTTWKPKRPRGCRAYEFECQGWPAAVVEETSGTPCTLFESRAGSSGSNATRRTTKPKGGLYG